MDSISVVSGRILRLEGEKYLFYPFSLFFFYFLFETSSSPGSVTQAGVTSLPGPMQTDNMGLLVPKAGEKLFPVLPCLSWWF